MSRTLSNRIRQAEKSAAFRQRPKRPGGMAAFYALIADPEKLEPGPLKQMIMELSTPDLLELKSTCIANGAPDLSSVPTNTLIKARDSRTPDKVLADWIGSQPC